MGFTNKADCYFESANEISLVQPWPMPIAKPFLIELKSQGLEFCQSKDLWENFGLLKKISLHFIIEKLDHGWRFQATNF